MEQGGNRWEEYLIQGTRGSTSSAAARIGKQQAWRQNVGRGGRGRVVARESAGGGMKSLGGGGEWVGLIEGEVCGVWCEV